MVEDDPVDEETRLLALVDYQAAAARWPKPFLWHDLDFLDQDEPPPF
jgi:hypothetical protein